MKKIPTAFVRVFEGYKIVDVLNQYTNEACEEAVLHGVPTIKWDGAACAVIRDTLYKRIDMSKAKKPANAEVILCQQSPDHLTGHWPAWIKCSRDNPADKWFFAAYDNYFDQPGRDMPMRGTFEAVGLHFNGNPYQMQGDTLIPHGKDFAHLENYGRGIIGIRDFLRDHEVEGIVFWLNGHPVCKIKRTDFGLPWPIKK